MKSKYFLSIILLFASFLCYGQYTVTPDGVIPDSGNAFDVYNFPGKTAATLYSKVYSYVCRGFVSPKDVISKKDNEIISINAIIPISRKNLVSKEAYMEIIWSFEFKDEKIRINCPEVQRILFDIEFPSLGEIFFRQTTLLQENGIYSKSGKLKDDIMKASIEKFFNGTIANLSSNINNDEW